MDKLKAIFLVCALASFVGCGDESTNARLPIYVNESGTTINMVIIETYSQYEKFIVNGDTLHWEEWYVPVEWDCGLVNSRNCDPIRMELYFLNEPIKCLIFDGPIKDDGIDMRSWKSYKKGRFDLIGENYVPEYVYIITAEHRAMAKEEFCQ